MQSRFGGFNTIQMSVQMPAAVACRPTSYPFASRGMRFFLRGCSGMRHGGLPRRYVSRGGTIKELLIGNPGPVVFRFAIHLSTHLYIPRVVSYPSHAPHRVSSASLHAWAEVPTVFGHLFRTPHYHDMSSTASSPASCPRRFLERDCSAVCIGLFMLLGAI